MTKLETVVEELLAKKGVSEDAERREKQAVLDGITPKVIAQLTPEELVENNRQVYNESAVEYATRDIHQNVIDELIPFMYKLEEGAKVLDVGCGPGRDALFMAISDIEYRKSKMLRKKGKDGKTTLEKYRWPPEHSLRVIGVDGSGEMVRQANTAKQEAIEKGFFGKHEEGSDGNAESKRKADRALNFLISDMHSFSELQGLHRFDAVWSCTALFTHTPPQFNLQALKNVSNLLKSGGLFFVSYTNGDATGAYDKLILSSAGGVKYFSQPSPGAIEQMARSYGLQETERNISDMTNDEGEVLKKDLFASQFFVKV